MEKRKIIVVTASTSRQEKGATLGDLLETTIAQRMILHEGWQIISVVPAFIDQKSLGTSLIATILLEKYETS